MITLLGLLIWQMPFASLGLYYVFVVNRDSPSVSVRSSVLSLVVLISSVAVEFAIVAGVMLPLLFGIIDLGLLMWTSNEIITGRTGIDIMSKCG